MSVVRGDLLAEGGFVFGRKRQFISAAVVLVMSEVIGRPPRFMHAIGANDVPGELESHHCKQDEKEASDHDVGQYSANKFFCTFAVQLSWILATDKLWLTW